MVTRSLGKPEDRGVIAVCLIEITQPFRSYATPTVQRNQLDHIWGNLFRKLNSPRIVGNGLPTLVKTCGTVGSQS